MTNDRRLLLALLDWNCGTEINLGYTPYTDLQVAISLIDVDVYSLRVGDRTTQYTALDELTSALSSLRMI